MGDNALITVAMQIILHAGNARNIAQDALAAAKKLNIDKAYELLGEAKKELTLAHKSQTEVIQAEAAGQSYDYSLLFNHAQDTLMTIQSEVNLSGDLIDILKLIKERTA